MNKIILCVSILTVIFLSFTVGYKLGDKRGYEEGYQSGYLYDCKEEIGLLHERVKAHEKGLEFTEQQIRSLTRANDSLRKPGVYDTMHARFARDSVKYHVRARIYNDSLAKLTGKRTNFILDNGKKNAVTCLLFPEYKALRECQDSEWSLSK